MIVFYMVVLWGEKKREEINIYIFEVVYYGIYEDLVDRLIKNELYLYFLVYRGMVLFWLVKEVYCYMRWRFFRLII